LISDRLRLYTVWLSIANWQAAALQLKIAGRCSETASLVSRFEKAIHSVNAFGFVDISAVYAALVSIQLAQQQFYQPTLGLGTCYRLTLPTCRMQLFEIILLCSLA